MDLIINFLWLFWIINRFNFIPGPQVIKLFSCSTQLSTKFQMLIKTKIPTNKEVSCCLSLSDGVFIMLINVKMPKIVGILTFMSRINFVLSWVEHEKSFITSRPVALWRVKTPVCSFGQSNCSRVSCSEKIVSFSRVFNCKYIFKLFYNCSILNASLGLNIVLFTILLLKAKNKMNRNFWYPI